MAREVTKKPVRRRTQSQQAGGKGALSVQKLSIKSKVKQGVPKGKRIHAKLVPEGKRVKIVIADNTKKLEKRVEKKQEKKTGGDRQIITRSNLELALLSPFRFPMPQERVIGSVARYAGVFFVLVGAIFSLVNLEYATGTFANMGVVRNQAQTIDGTYSGTTSTTTSGTAGTATPGGTTANYTTTTVDPTPDVRIAVEGQGTVLMNTAVLMINVPYAGEVKLVAEHKNGALMQLGKAFRVDASTWRFYWNTQQYPDGEYQLRAVVNNQYGSYEHKDSVWRLVDNVPDIVVNNRTTTDSTKTAEGSSTLEATGALVIPDAEAVLNAPNETEGATTTAEEPAVAEIAPALKTAKLRIPEASPLSGGAELYASVEGGTATAVSMYARGVLSGTLYYIDQGTYQSSEGEWYVDWNTKLVPDGEYNIRTKVTFSDQTNLDSPAVRRSVKNNATVPLTTASTTPVNTATSSVTLNPIIETRLSKASPVSGFVEVSVKVSDAVSVGVYAQKKDSLTPLFIGGAKKVSSTDWKYQWSTTQTPNGDYNLYVKVETLYGVTEGKRISVRVQNDVLQTFTEEQEKTIGTLADAGGALIQSTDDAGKVESVSPESGTTYTPPKVVYVESVTTFIETVDTSDGHKEEIETLLTNFRTRLNEKLNDLARAKRNGDEEALRAVRADIESIKEEVSRELGAGTEKREMLDRINAYISQVTSELEELTLKNEAILKERVGDALVKDSDKDGITDYDEVNLYLTNPFAADTDGDSYIDSVEIKLGYNPHDARSETLVTYESPKEVGIVREDLLTVDSITNLGETEEEEMNGESSAPKKALISGKGLPNSFVTLYVYSTPIVLTVKTDAEGSWSYVFDKELEEGEHEVYVGITDNAGRIVAKSNPLPFVKTAIAFNEAEAAAAPIEVSPEPTLVDERIMLLVASIAVVGLGLVLILLGLHVRGRQEDSVLAPST